MTHSNADRNTEEKRATPDGLAQLGLAQLEIGIAAAEREMVAAYREVEEAREASHAAAERYNELVRRKVQWEREDQ